MIEFPVKVAFLQRPDSYPERPPTVDVVETHMSCVFLTRDFAYKLKKPIRYEQLDFSTLERRRHFCAEEVRLNRRLAEPVYLGTLALTTEADGRLAVGGAGEPVDWLVHMRRLPAAHMLDAVMARRPVSRCDVHEVASSLASFYARAPSIPTTVQSLRTRLHAGLQADLRELNRPEFGLDRGRIDDIARVQLAFLEERGSLLEERARAGRIVDGHGDLRPEHVCLAPTPAVIDCLEFCAELRELDPLDELAFLTLECERLGQPGVGQWFLDAYTASTRDDPPEALLRFYRAYRALRRARLAVWHLDDPTVRDAGRFALQARRYLELARP